MTELNWRSIFSGLVDRVRVTIHSTNQVLIKWVTRSRLIVAGPIFICNFIVFGQREEYSIFNVVPDHLFWFWCPQPMKQKAIDLLGSP